MPKKSRLELLCNKRRIEAYEEVPKLYPKDIDEKVTSLNKRLSDKNPQVRGSACSFIGHLSPKDIAKLAPALTKLLKDEYREVRREACWALGQLSPKQLIEHSQPLVALLRDPCSQVRVASCDALGRLPVDYLMQHKSLLEQLLTGHCEGTCWAASKALRRLAPEQLGWYTFTMSRLIADEAIDVSTLKLHPIGGPPTMRESVLLEFLKDRNNPLQSGVISCSAQYVEALANRVVNVAAPERNAAGNALGILPLPVLRSCPLKTKQVDALLKWLDEQLQQRKPLPKVFSLPIEKTNAEGSTWLHLAAKYGSPRACRALRDAGAALARRNRQKKRPCDLAAEAGHRELASELQPSTLETRGSTGDGMEDALACEDFIEEVTWWTLPLPSIGSFGGKHSLLKIKAGYDIFVVESASPDEHSGAQAGGIAQEAARNGLFVSHWTDVPDANDFEALDVVPKLEVRQSITLRQLLEHLVTGQYDAANHNCHHTAMKGYNLCAERQDRLTRLPVNRFLIGVAWALSKVGFKVAPSACCGQQSRCAGGNRTRARGSSSCSCSGRMQRGGPLKSGCVLYDVERTGKTESAAIWLASSHRFTNSFI